MSIYRIVIESGNSKNRSFNLSERKSITIGRANDCDVMLDDDNASRKHCVITLNKDRVILRDLDSTNGTYVNGFAVRERELIPRDNIRIGNVFLALQKIEDIDAEVEDQGIFEQMRRGKGYNTILAEMVGEKLETDVAGILERKPKQEKTQLFLKKELRKLGYDETESDIIVNRFAGNRVESFPKDIVVVEKSPKPNELHVTLKEPVKRIKTSSLVCHNNQDYLVVAIKDEPAGTTTYILKVC
jgi:hypothetical protein